MTTSTAKITQGALMQVAGGTGGAVTITAIAKTFPVRLTATAHGLVNGDVVAIASVGGMVEVNGVTAVVEYVTANTFALHGIDATAYTTYTSGGTATPVTWVSIANIKTVSFDDGSSTEIPTTHLRSTAKEFRLGLQDGGSAKFDFDTDMDDSGQAALLALKASGAVGSFKITFTEGTVKTVTFTGLVKTMSTQGGVDDVLKGSLEIRNTGGYTRT